MVKSSIKYPSLSAVKGEGNVFQLRKPKDNERMALMQDLISAFPNVYLWRSTEDADRDLDALLGSPSAQTDAALVWKIEAGSIQKVLEQLYEGGWAMFFFASPSVNLAAFPEKLETKPEGLRQLTSRTGTDVTLVSWYDDTEWLIAFRDSSMFFSKT
jgi:hypothetical protein